MNQTILTLFLGLVLGIKHAFDADHMLAVSTIVTRLKNPLKAAFVGTFWGMGHTTTLFIIGLIVLLLNIKIPENINLSLEFVVGIMLVLLGIRAIKRHRSLSHTHTHKHDEKMHTHFHDHRSTHHHRHRESFIIGLIHGLAGSGALMLLVLSTIDQVLIGIYYILIFGIGSILGMTFMSIIFGIPFIYSSKKLPILNKYLTLFSGSLSILFGLFVMYEIGYVQGLLI